jgi:hypothetical protein
MLKCNVCFVEKQLNEFYDSNSSRGKQYMCIPCYKAYFKAWREARTAKAQSVHVQSKVCNDCGLERPIGHFGKRSSSLDKHNSYCKDCWRVRTKAAQKRHLNKVKNG